MAITSRSAAQARQLGFEGASPRERAIEAIYRWHRIWPKDDPQPAPGHRTFQFPRSILTAEFS